MLIAGIDEAGRGPVVGPMVIGLAVINKEDEKKLLNIGVKDSKLLSDKRRKEIYGLLNDFLLEFKSIKISPKELDELMEDHSLNEIEAMYASKLIRSLKHKPDIIYVDSPDSNEEVFAKRLFSYLGDGYKIISKHKADYIYPVVSAASIIAKVERDLEIEKIKEKLSHDFGSGYPSDERTIRFLKSYAKLNGKLPDFVRKKWKTNDKIRQFSLWDYDN